MISGILISGWAHSASYLDPLGEALGSVITCATCSPHSLHPTPAENLQQLADRMRANVLIGWSLGGMIALETALRQPAGLRGLVLMAATARFCRSSDYHAGLNPAELRAMKIGLKQNPRDTLRRFHTLVYSPAVPAASTTDQFVDQALAQRAEILVSGLDYLLTKDFRRQLASLNVPVLLIHGSNDAVVPPAASMYISSRVPQTSLRMVKDHGHALPLTASCAVAKAISDFLDSISR